MPDYHVAWWNVENLFDEEDSAQRPQYLQNKLASELVGWTPTVLATKIQQLTSIISQMNNNQGPDILGVCEIENIPVMNLLVAALAPLGRNYAVAHHDTSDARGIDVAFIYDSDQFTFERDFHYEVLKRSATRDIYQVNLTTVGGNRLILIGNHWPSRLGDPAYRIVAAETLSYWIQRIHEELAGEPSTLVMGDFNDEPFDRSLADFALSSRTTARVLNAQNDRLFNLMWPLLDEVPSYVYKNTPNMLDQFLVSRGMLTANPTMSVVDGSVSVVRFPETIAPGDYQQPKRFSRPSKADYDPTGFSDHYPISLTLREV